MWCVITAHGLQASPLYLAMGCAPVAFWVMHWHWPPCRGLWVWTMRGLHGIYGVIGGTGRVWVVREAVVQYACGMFGVCYIWCGGVLRLYGVNVVWGIHVLWGGWVYGVYM